MQQNRGMVYTRGGSKRRKQAPDDIVDSSSIDLPNEGLSAPTNHKKWNMENQSPAGSSGVPSLAGSPSRGPPGMHYLLFKFLL